ncbi:MAG: hypothetical protein ACT4QA_23115 [Panacagrimonas sp.]
MVVVFTNVRSPYYDLALNVAQGATRFTQTQAGKTTINIAAIGKSQDQVGRAMVLLRYVADWNTTQVFVGGRFVRDMTRLQRMLDCYQTALSCVDNRAHCHVVTDRAFRGGGIVSGYPLTLSLTRELQQDPRPPPPRFTMPCKIVATYSWLDRSHLSKWEDQVQAGAVEFGVDCCPFYDGTAFRQFE